MSAADHGNKLNISAEARRHLDAANTLFPERYELQTDARGNFVVYDRHKRRAVSREPIPEEATRKALSSARLSSNNGNRKYDHGAAPEARTLTLPPATWAKLEQIAHNHELTLSELLISLTDDRTPLMERELNFEEAAAELRAPLIVDSANLYDDGPEPHGDEGLNLPDPLADLSDDEQSAVIGKQE